MEANASIDAAVVTVLEPVVFVTLAIVLVAGMACVVEVGWVVVGRHPTWRRSIAPRALRRTALGVCGVALVVAAPATAPAVALTDISGPRTEDAGNTCRAPCPPTLDGLRLPDLPASTDRRAADGAQPAPPRPRAAVRRSTVVRAGDSLWSIARDLIGRRVPDDEIVELVDSLYADNRARIGPDPDLIFPGNRLSTPEVIR